MVHFLPLCFQLISDGWTARRKEYPHKSGQLCRLQQKVMHHAVGKFVVAPTLKLTEHVDDATVPLVPVAAGVIRCN